jgi:hypothetical protein
LKAETAQARALIASVADVGPVGSRPRYREGALTLLIDAAVNTLTEAERDAIQHVIDHHDRRTITAWLAQAADDAGRIATPVDDGMPGELDRRINPTDDQRMLSRYVTHDALWRRFLELATA